MHQKRKITGWESKNENKNRRFIQKLTPMLSVLLCIGTGMLVSGCQTAVSDAVQDSISDTTPKTALENHAMSQPASFQNHLSPALEQDELYRNFLQKHRGEKEFSYYSLADLGAEKTVLLTTSQVEEQYAIRHYQLQKVSRECQIYITMDGAVVPYGKITCSKGQWIHIKEKILLTGTDHSIEKNKVTKEDNRLFTTSCVKTTTNGNSAYYLDHPVQSRKQTTKREYKKWKTMFTLADSVIFYENKKQTLTEDMENYAQFLPPAMTIKKYADVTGDGIKDIILIDTSKAMDATAHPTVKVLSGATRKVIWKDYSNASVHAGYSSLYLYQKNGTSYLMEWNPGVWQGMAGFYWKIFRLTEQGKRTIIAKDRVDFDTNPGRMKKSDFSRIRSFGKKLNSYLKNATILIDTINYYPLKIDNPYEKEDLSFDYEEFIHLLKEDM